MEEELKEMGIQKKGHIRMLITKIKLLQIGDPENDGLIETQEGEQPALHRAQTSQLLNELWEEDNESQKRDSKGVTIMGNDIELEFRESVQ